MSCGWLDLSFQMKEMPLFILVSMQPNLISEAGRSAHYTVFVSVLYCIPYCIRYLYCRCKESCQILTMQLGDALLLKSTLAESLHSLDSHQIQDPISTVQELGIFKLTPEDVELVLSRRNDLLRNL